jgi:hypothetical protein
MGGKYCPKMRVLATLSGEMALTTTEELAAATTGRQARPQRRVGIC